MSAFKSRGGLDSIINRPRQTQWQQFWEEPCIFSARKLYASRFVRPFESSSNPIAVVCISDTHNTKPRLPEGDILIHAGDATQSGTLAEFQATIDWLDEQPHQHKILIGGNHEVLLGSQTPGKDESMRGLINWRSITYLENEAVTLVCSGSRQVKVYGSPLTPRHGNWVFQYDRTVDVWTGKVPLDTDILITHGPPKAHLDLGSGCEFLLREVWRVRPRLHVFGHIHAGYEQECVQFDGRQAAFEEVVKARGGVGRLLRLVYTSIVAWLKPAAASSTLLVNAAVVGGIRDEERRGPIMVKL